MTDAEPTGGSDSEGKRDTIREELKTTRAAYHELLDSQDVEAEVRQHFGA